MALKQLLFETLQELGDEEFRHFKWFLQQSDSLDGLPVIPKSHLENADRQETVDQMAQKHNRWSVEVLKKNLQKIHRKDLVEKLSNFNRTGQDMENPQTIRNYQERLQSNLQDTFRCRHEGWSSKRNTVNLDEVYTELCITTEGDQPVSRFIRRIEMAFGKPSEPKISNIFTHPLISCNLSRRSCETLSSVLGSESCSLEELDMSSNDLQDLGMELLSAGLNSPHCKLETLRVCECELSEDISDTLSLSELSSLRQLDLRNNELGPSGQEMCLCCAKITVWTHNISLGEIISKSVLIRSGCPSVYQLRVKKQKSGPLTRVTVGEKEMDKMNRKIVLVGETRAEKCGLINALFNYSIGVRFDDDVWFQVVEKEGGQTADVMLYEIFGFEDKTLPFPLSIIDAPGYEEIERDAIIREKLSDFLLVDDKVVVVVVCLVLRAGDSLQSSRLKNTYDSVMSLFGEQEDRCTVILIMNSDGRNHRNILQDLETTKMKFIKNEKREPFYFLFNNRQHEDRTGHTDELEQAYKLSDRQLGKFTGFLKEAECRMVSAAFEERHEHGRLKACIQNLKDRMQLMDLKVAEIKQIQEALQKHEEEDITNNESFSIEMDEVYKDTEAIEGGRWLWFFYDGALCCTVCEENCHYPGCTVAMTPEDCEVIKDGLCAACTNKCPVSAHVKEQWRYVTKTKRVEVTLPDVRQKYERNKSESENKIGLLDHLEEELKHQKAKKSQIVEEIFQHVVRLQQIDPKDDSLSKYLDLLTEAGNTEMVLRLEDMRRQDDQNPE